MPLKYATMKVESGSANSIAEPRQETRHETRADAIASAVALSTGSGASDQIVLHCRSILGQELWTPVNLVQADITDPTVLELLP